MIFRKKIILFLLFAFLKVSVNAQDTLSLSVQELRSLLLQYHPVAKRSGLLSLRAEAQQKIARGQFDPKIEADWNGKTFDKKNYFNLLSSQIKIPTWYGVDIKAGYDVNSGVYLDPSNKTPTNGLATMGVSVPLLRGLVTDERRTMVRQANIMREMSELEQRKMLNDLFYDAYKAYWEWSLDYTRQVVAKQFYNITKQRFDNVKELFRRGDRPAIDTLEAFIQLQERQVQQNEARMNYISSTMQLSNFLWDANEQPVALNPNTRIKPLNLVTQETPLPTQDMTGILANITAQHPDLLLYLNEKDLLAQEIRLKKENLKPQLNANYNLLAKEWNYVKDYNPIQNYKWGVSFQVPIFQRKERGSLDMSRLKVQDVDYKLVAKRLELENKLKAAFNEWEINYEQYQLYGEIVKNQDRLYRAEITRLELGESTLFLVNSRETKLLETQLKRIELQAKIIKAYVTVNWVSVSL